MSKTYRRTMKGQKRDWLPRIGKWDIEQDKSWRGIYLRPDEKKIDWLKDNPHRRKDVDDYFHWMKDPSYWIREMMTRPCRAKEKQIETKILKDELDPDNVVWPTNKKPHKYYW